MAQYSEEQKRALLQIPIPRILEVLGKNSHKSSGNMYHSPFREESAPSFHIDPKSNTWYDFGEGRGGGVIDLVSEIKGCSRSDVYDFLFLISKQFPLERAQSVRRSPTSKTCKSRVLRKDLSRKTKASKIKDEEKNISIQRCDSLFSETILNYATTRCISLPVLEKYCSMVEFSVNDDSRTMEAIGFRNNDGGLVLRTPSMKLCTSSAITTLGPNGRKSIARNKAKALVFEGFIDFLSWLSYNNVLEPGFDCCILNSVTNLPQALEWICMHTKIAVFTDNDTAGEKAYVQIAQALEALPSSQKKQLYHMANTYEGHKDVNEWFMAISKAK